MRCFLFTVIKKQTKHKSTFATSFLSMFFFYFFDPNKTPSLFLSFMFHSSPIHNSSPFLNLKNVTFCSKNVGLIHHSNSVNPANSRIKNQEEKYKMIPLQSHQKRAKYETTFVILVPSLCSSFISFLFPFPCLSFTKTYV